MIKSDFSFKLWNTQVYLVWTGGALEMHFRPFSVWAPYPLEPVYLSKFDAPDSYQCTCVLSVLYPREKVWRIDVTFILFS